MTLHNHSHSHRHAPGLSRPAASERGSAMVIVIGVIAVLTLMILHISVASGILAKEVQVAVARMQLRYDAESAAEHACWMFISDRKRHPSRTISTSQEVALSIGEDEVRWQADGSGRQLDLPGMNAVVAILDADQGLDISAANAAQNLKTLLAAEEAISPEASELLPFFTDQITDYIDGGDDFRRLNGMENPDYAAQGWPDLPRNNPLQFREEILWIPAVPEFMALLGMTSPAELVGSLRLIPPRGSSFPRQQKPNFFGASSALLRSKLNLDSADAAMVMEARDRWQRGDSGALDGLPPEILAQIRGQFSFAETGIVTVTATATLPGTEIKRSLRLTRDCRTPPPANSLLPAWENWEMTLDPAP